MNILVVIPAWTGSRRIPNKNLADVAGQSLLERTIRFALSLPIDARIVVNTDIVDGEGNRTVQEITDLFRPRVEVCTCTLHDGTTSGSNAVWRYTHRAFADHTWRTILLEPSSPMRERNDILQCLNALNPLSSPYVMTVTRVKTVFHGPQPTYNGACYAAIPSYTNEPAFIPIAGPQWHPVETPWRINIDTPHDLEIARKILT